MSIRAGLIVALICFVARGANAQLVTTASEGISFQGFATNNSGIPINATVNVTTTFYKKNVAGYSQVHANVPIVDGVFNVVIGPVDTVKFDQPIELGIKLGADPEIAPRTLLQSSPYALGIRGLYAKAVDDGLFQAYNVVGGGNNVVSPGATGVTVSGGGGWSKIGGGIPTPILNTALSDYATIGGGLRNKAHFAATVGGGQLNQALGSSAAVGGGAVNVASGAYATVPGGDNNRAAGQTSLAAGYWAKALHDGSFVWSDRSGSLVDSLASTGSNQFLIRAVGGVGIGTNAPITQLHVRESINSTASAANHVALIDNSSTGSSADVLALRIARTANPETTNVFVSFLNGGNAAGVIRGNGSGGVELFSSGSDYAELLERIDPSERIEAGDVVAVTSGKISRRAETAERYMVISDRPIVVGNMQDSEREHLYERVAFIGQVPVKVTGPVRAGDFLLASRLGDGSAIAVSPSNIRTTDLNRIAAVAWESSDDPGIKTVISEVGLDRSAAVQMALQNELAELRALLQECRPASIPINRAGLRPNETGASGLLD